MNEKQGVSLSGKDAARLLEGLTKDPQLRSEDDASGEEHRIVGGQHYHHPAMGKTTYPSLVGGAEGHVDRAEEQNSEIVPVHCHN